MGTKTLTVVVCSIEKPDFTLDNLHQRCLSRRRLNIGHNGFQEDLQLQPPSHVQDKDNICWIPF